MMRAEDELDRLVKDAFNKREIYDMHRARNIYGLTYEEAQAAYVEMERARAESAKANRAANDYIDSMATPS
jgi:hypothetical protein